MKYIFIYIIVVMYYLNKIKKKLKKLKKQKKKYIILHKLATYTCTIKFQKLIVIRNNYERPRESKES